MVLNLSPMSYRGILQAFFLSMLILFSPAPCMAKKDKASEGKGGKTSLAGGGFSDQGISTLSPGKSGASEYFVSDEASIKSFEAASALFRLRGTFSTILQYFLGILALVALVTTVFNFIKGDQGGATRMIFWLLGAVVGFILLSIFGSVKADTGSASGLGFSAIKNEVLGILTALLSVVSMISGTVAVYHLMKGEREGTEKVLKTFIVSVVGSILLSIV